MKFPRRLRMLVMIQGIELEDEQALLDLWALNPQLPDPPPDAATYDPLQDHLDEPFPEELR